MTQRSEEIRQKALNFLMEICGDSFSNAYPDTLAITQEVDLLEAFAESLSSGAAAPQILTGPKGEKLVRTGERRSVKEHDFFLTNSSIAQLAAFTPGQPVVREILRPATEQEIAAAAPSGGAQPHEDSYPSPWPKELINLLRDICRNAYACHYQQDTFPGESQPCGECANCKSDKVLGEGWRDLAGAAPPAASPQPAEQKSTPGIDLARWIWGRFVGIPITEPYDKEFRLLLLKIAAYTDEIRQRESMAQMTPAGIGNYVHSKPGCPFMYCDQEAPYTACLERCRHGK